MKKKVLTAAFLIFELTLPSLTSKNCQTRPVDKEKKKKKILVINLLEFYIRSLLVFMGTQLLCSIKVSLVALGRAAALIEGRLRRAGDTWKIEAKC